MKLLKLIAAILLFSACGNNNSDVKSTEIDSSGISDTVYTPLKDKGNTYEVVDAKGYYVWDVNVEKKTLKKNPAIITADIDSVISGLNSQYENIFLEKVILKKDTLHLKIDNSEYLTNQMGSAGAAQYIAQTVINLVSVPGIKYATVRRAWRDRRAHRKPRGTRSGSISRTGPARCRGSPG